MSLRRSAHIAFCLVVLIAAGCDSGSGAGGEGGDDRVMSVDRDDDRPPLAPLQGEVVINHSGAPPDQWGSDDYVIETGKDMLTGEDRFPFIEGDTLTVTVSYGGGCRQHDFTLVSSSAFMESNPVQLRVDLAHDARGDPCTAYPTEDYVFDLTPVRMLYQESYRLTEGVIVLHLRGRHESAYTLTYEF